MDLGLEVRDPLAEQLPPLSSHEALVEADRCLYCYDAPCTHACPTHIDVPKFIKKIASRNLLGAATTILNANLLGATCARVCPVQELCEGACVLGSSHRPISIGRLQRYATDFVAQSGIDPIKPGLSTDKRVAVVGSGPAGLSCAGELRKFGHAVTVFERRQMSGGLSTYGIIKLREPIEIATQEAEMIGRMGVSFQHGIELGVDMTLNQLEMDFDAIFLGIGLGVTPSLDIAGESQILDGLQVIEQSKLNNEMVHIGKHVTVIGAGNTAIDCATIAKRLGSETVTVVYRRSEREMTAYPHEVDFVRLEGVDFRFLTQPVKVIIDNSKVIGLECVRMTLGESDASGRALPIPIASTNFVIPTDQIIKAIGQEKPTLAVQLGIDTENGYIKVNNGFETSRPGVFAGGDCIRANGSASTVMAVQDGKLAALAIHRQITHGGK